MGTNIAMNNTTDLLTEQGETPCSPFANDHYVGVAILSACTGGVSAVASLLVICGILVSKKYLFFIQRLILYLSITVFLNSLSVVLRLQRTIALGGHSDDTLHPLCVFTAFADQTTSWSTLVAISCITCYLLLNVVLLRPVVALEKLYVVLIIALPLSFNWIPFIKGSYGEAGAWCWIRGQDDSCQQKLFGIYLRFILWYIPLYVVLLAILVAYLYILYRVKRLRGHWDGKIDPSNKTTRDKMMKEFRPLVWYPLIYLILSIFPTINRIHGAFYDEPSLALWILHAFFSPLRGGFIALAYALDGQTVRRLLRNRSAILAAVLKRKNNVEEYPSTRGHSDSFVSTNGKSQLNTNSSNNSGWSEGSRDTELQTECIALSTVEAVAGGGDGSGNRENGGAIHTTQL